MKGMLVGLVSALMLVACGTVPIRAPVAPQIRFDPAAHERWKETGTGVIEGQAFLRQQGGGVVTCAGSEVALVPRSPYFQEIVRIGRSGQTPDMSGVNLQGIGRKTMCDAQGRFRFADLPAAEWFVMTEVRWSVGYAQQGGGLGREVESEENRTVEVLLTDRDR